MEAQTQLVHEVYALVSRLPRFDHKTPSTALPKNGVYFFYERGEFVRSDSSVLGRIVRIGTHRKTDRFRGRIRQHYGSVSSLSGNKNSSVFRKHLGGALLNKANPEDPRIKAWLMQDGPTFKDVEELVSLELRERFTFACLRVDNPQDRKDLEQGLIALLARYSLDQPTPEWLGRYALASEIRQYGLWNTQHTDGEPLTSNQFHFLERFVASTSSTSPYELSASEAPSNSDSSSSSRSETLTSKSIPRQSTVEEILVIVPCGKAKIWDKEPKHGPAPAREAYTGPLFRVNRRYAEYFTSTWLILSAKYGLIAPTFEIPKAYNVTFKDAATIPISVSELREQVDRQHLREFHRIIGLGGSEYREILRLVFVPNKVCFPFAHCKSQGQMMRAINAAVASGKMSPK